MKVVVLADLHGNMVATEAMERELDAIQPDEIWFLGDAVGKGPESDKTIDWVRKHCNHWIAGNWDRILSEVPEKNAFYIKQIGPERLEWLNSLPLEDELEIGGLRFRLVHGRPLDPLYSNDDPGEKLLGGCRFHDGRPDADGLICADAHRPFIRPLKDGYAINTGSIGNNLGATRAHALLLEGEHGSGPIRMTIISVPYDNRKAAEIADSYPELPKKEAYQNEVLTGVYSR
ncbi:MAG: metallophosphoesterase family protein [Lachnospiraceae bacterium]|nr:metallophosphoesterase family protein [Lachnospiraceae bacterium]MBR5677971.1 metallophosphoesterase family protein [Paludibacteraceae bacterium]